MAQKVAGGRADHRIMGTRMAKGDFGHYVGAPLHGLAAESRGHARAFPTALDQRRTRVRQAARMALMVTVDLLS